VTRQAASAAVAEPAGSGIGALRGTARDALDIADSGIDAIDGFGLVQRALAKRGLQRRFERASRVYCVALGKVAEAMFEAVAESVGPEIWAGGVVVSGVSTAGSSRTPRFVGAHPLPDRSSVVAAAAVVRFLARARLQPSDLVVVCVSGGTSSMICAPVPPLTVTDLRDLTRRLLRSGADVTTINQLRRVISSLHGGGLAALIAPAAGLGLILSDNVQVGASAVGSGPTFPLATGLAEAVKVLDAARLPDPLRRRTMLAIHRRLSDPILTDHVINIVVGRPLDAVAAARDRARHLGYDCLVLSSTVQGEAREVAKVIGSILRHRWERGGRKFCLLAAGEVVVTVRGSGLGGRCQELAWAVARELDGRENSAFAAVATDGQDYLDGVGGAWVTDSTLADLAAAGFDWAAALAANDTFGGLSQLGNLLPGRQTNANLCDLYVACVDRAGGSPSRVAAPSRAFGS
jgi:glycerate 2-kinase